MIVLDASALIELLTGTAAGHRIADRISDPAMALHIPQLAFVEVTQVLRRFVASGALTPAEAETAMSDLLALGAEAHDHEMLLGRIWQLRNNFTAYDATYVALAEALDAVVLTCDRKLAAAPAAAGLVELC